MTVESASYIHELSESNPAPTTGPKPEGDDHLRLVKLTIKNTLPNISGAVTITQADLNKFDGSGASTDELNVFSGALVTTDELNILASATLSTEELNKLDGATVTTNELNILDGVTASTSEVNFLSGVSSGIQVQLDSKAPLTSPTLTGTPTSVTAALGTNTTQIATTAYIEQLQASPFPETVAVSVNYPKVNAGETSLEADTLSADEITASGAATLQALVDDLDTKVDGLLAFASSGDASDLSFDNTSTGYTASDFQAAIDELDGKVDNTQDALPLPGFDDAILMGSADGTKQWVQVDPTIFTDETEVTITSSQTWTVPAGVDAIRIEAVGGGGGGGRFANDITTAYGGGTGGSTVITYNSGTGTVISCPGGRGGESHDIGSEPEYGGDAGGAAGANATLSLGTLVSYGTATRGRHGSHQGENGHGGYNELRVGYVTSGSPSEAGNGGKAGGYYVDADDYSAGGGGASRVCTFLLDVRSINTLEISIGAAGSGGGGLTSPNQRGYAGAVGQVKIYY